VLYTTCGSAYIVLKDGAVVENSKRVYRLRGHKTSSRIQVQYRPYAGHEGIVFWCPKFGVVPHHEIIASYVIVLSSVHSKPQNLHIRRRYSHDITIEQLPLHTNLTLQNQNYFSKPYQPPTTYSTCLPTSAAQASTRLLTSALSPTLRSSKRRTRTASTRARSTRTRHRTPVRFATLLRSRRVRVAYHPTMPRHHHITAIKAANTHQQRTSGQSPTSSSVRRSARTRARRSPSRTGSASKTLRYRPAPTATNPPRAPRSTRS
jgi:hypothetical protein